jgi:hypothetical protein
MKYIILAIILSGCSKPVEKNELPSYSDMSAAQDAQEVLTHSQ